MNQFEQVSNTVLTGFISGDMACFEEVYLCYKDRTYYYALKLTRSELLAEEVVQDVFVKIWSNREKIDLKYSFASFVFRVTHNHIINVLKRISYEKTVKDRFLKSSEICVSDTEDKVIYKEYMEILSKAIDQLPPRRKDVFNMSRNKGIGHDEIALEMGISKNTVKSQLVKATKSIRKYFSMHGELAI